MDEPSTPRREVMVQIVDAGYAPPSDDQVDRRHAAGLICEPPSQGRPPVYGYTAAQAERLLAIARLEERLKSKRLPYSEIAFWLCFEGATDVPAALVCEHIKVAIETFQSRGLRILNELGRRNEGAHIDILGVAKKLGGLLARKIVLRWIPSLGRSSLAREVLGAGLGLFLRASAKPIRYSEVSGDVRRTVTALRSDSTPPPGPVLRELFSVVVDFSQLLRFDADNAMLVAIRSIASADPNHIFDTVEFARNTLNVASRVFPWMIDPSVLPYLDEADREFLDRYYAPLLCGAIATVRGNQYSENRAEQLRAGNIEPSLAEFTQMKQLSDHIMTKVSPEDRSDERP